MARPRTLTNEQVLALVSASLEQTGTAWTLANAAEAAGLHPATLIKRFGSRHGLLLALSRRWVDSIPAGATTANADAELLEWAASLTFGEASATLLVARMDMLVADIHDDQLRSLLHQGWAKHSAYLGDLVQRCQNDGHLTSRLSAEKTAELLLDIAHGSLLRAAVHPIPSEINPGRSVMDLLETLR